MKVSHSRERWVLIGALCVFVLVVGAIGWGFWLKIDRLQELYATEQELIPLVANAKERNWELRDTLAHVSSADYPEEWARVYAGQVQPGEVRVELVLPEAPEEQVVASDQDGALSFWQQAWQWLTGEH